MKRKQLMTVLLLLAGVLGAYADAEILEVIDGVTYKQLPDGNAAVVKIEKEGGEIRRIPGTVTLDGKSTTVTVLDVEESKINNRYGKLLTLPETIDSLAAIPGYNCIHLQSAKAPRTSKTIPSYTYLIPASSYDSYKSASNWKNKSFYTYDGIVADTLFYTLNDDDNTAVVMRLYNMSMRVVIPETITSNGKQYTVTEIGNSCIQNSVSFLVIPKTIKKIGSYFCSNSSFVCYVLADQPPVLNSSNSLSSATLCVKKGKRYTYSGWYSSWGESGKFGTIVEGDIFDMNYAYSLNKGEATLEKVITTSKEHTIPASVMDVDGTEYPVTSIGASNTNSGPFYQREVRSLTLPNTIKSIGNYAFRSCYGNATIQLPSSLETIGDYAFSDATIKSIEIPASVKSIGYNYGFAFSGATIKNIIVDENNPYFKSDWSKSIVDEKVELREQNKQLLTSDGVLLYYCYSDEAQENTYIDALAIYENAIGKIKLGKLYLSSKLNNVSFKLGYNSYSNGAYISGYTFFRADISEFAIYNPDNKYTYFFTDETGKGLLYRGYGESNKEFIAYAGSVDDKPYYYSDPVKYTIPDDVKTISSNAFACDYQPEIIEVPKGVESIGSSAFKNSYGENVYLGLNWRGEPEYGIYERGTVLKELYMYCPMPSYINYDVCSNYVYENAHLYVQKSDYENYSSNTPWSNFKNIHTMQTGLDDQDYMILKQFYEEMNGDYWYNKWELGVTAEEITEEPYGVTIKHGHVTEIYLPYNGLSGTLTSTLFNMPNIERIDISNNSISGYIENALQGVNNNLLTYLNISSNSIYGNIGSVTNALPNLTTLYAQYNNISEVSPALPYGLTNVDLSGQSIYSTARKFTEVLGSSRSALPTIMTYNVSERDYSAKLSIGKGSWRVYLTGPKLAINTTEGYNRTYKDALDAKGYLYGENAYIPVTFDFISGDVDFSTAFDVADIQKTINYIFEHSSSTLFNFTAGNLVSDTDIDVLDLVSEVNMLLDSDKASLKAKGMKRTDDIDLSSTDHASLFWRGGTLMMQSDKPVAAMDITLSGDAVAKWLPDASRYDSRSKQSGNTQRIVHCSLSGYTMEGETALADAGAKAMTIKDVTAVDADGNYIPVVLLSNDPTGINSINDDNGENGMIFSVDGKKLPYVPGNGIIIIKKGQSIIKVKN